jgi:NitT/TauT family transport system permease protein
MKKIIDFIKKYSITILIYLGFIGVYVLMSLDKDKRGFLFPDINKVGEVFVKEPDVMLLNLLNTFQLLVPSVIISLIIALSVGTILGMNKKLREVLFPVIYSISVVPSILMAPFALLIAPTFRAASMFLVVYNTIWATLFATINGIMTIDKRYLDNASTLEITGFKRFSKIIMPAAMPSIMSGFVTSLRGSFVVLVYAEMYGAKYGLGYYVKKYSEYGMYERSWAGFVFMVVVLVIVMQIFEKIKNNMLKWTLN